MFNFQKIKLPKALNKLIFSIIPAMCFVGLGSCRLFLQNNITDTLKDRSQIIRVAQADYDYNYPVDKDGYISIPSNKDAQIRYLIQNPQGVELDYQLWANSDSNEKYNVFNDFKRDFYDKLNNTDNWARTSISKDSDIVYLDLPRQMLFTMEMNDIPFEISPSLVLSPKRMGDYSLPIDPYHDKLRVNSPPLPVQGGCVMLDRSYKVPGGSQGKYVLCFNLPDSIFDESSIHRDLDKFYISGISMALNIENHGLVDGNRYSRGLPLEINFNDRQATDYLPEITPNEMIFKNIYNNIDSGDGLWAAEFHPESHAVYIVDDVYAEYGKNVEYTITLEDKKGLTSTVKVSTNSPQLMPVTMFCENTEKAPGYSYVDITGLGGIAVNLVPSKKIYGSERATVTDVDVVYEVFKVDDINRLSFLDCGYETGTKSLYLSEGDYYIKAYARKEGYLDSMARVWMLRVGPWKEVTVNILGASQHGKILLLNPDPEADMGTGYDNIDQSILDKNTIVLHKEDLYLYNHQEEVFHYYYKLHNDSSQQRTRTIKVFPKVWDYSTGEWFSDEEVAAMVTSTKFILYGQEDHPETIGQDFYNDDPDYDDNDPYTAFIPDIYFGDLYSGPERYRLFVEYMIDGEPIATNFSVIID